MRQNNTFSLKKRRNRIVMYLLMAIIAVVVSFSVAGAWFVDRDTVDSTMDMGGAVIVKLVGTGEDGTIQNFKQLYDSDGGAYPGDKILDSIKVQMGEKTEESVLRVQYSVDILDKEKKPKTEDLTEAETKLATLLKNDLRAKTTLFSSDWTPTSDWIYYKHLASGKTKPIDLFDEYSLPLPDSEMDNQYQELSFRISLVAEAIQAANILSHDEWNDDITNLSDSALMERVIKYNAERFADIDEVLPYIENSGTQYINTEYYWKTDNVRAVLSANIITHNQAQSLFGNEEYIGSDRYFALIPHNSGGTMKIFSLNRNLVNFSYPLSTDIILDVSATKQNSNNYVNLAITANQTTTNYGGKATTDGSVITNPNKLDSGVGQIYLFANHNSGKGAVNGTTTPNMNGIQIVSKMRVYSFKMYDDGELVRCFVPARDKDGNVGLYDIVTKKMYLNQGSGNFSYGHSITYVTNGGTLDPSSPKTFVSSDLPITLKTPTRDGYEFGGWFLSSDFSGAAQTTIPAGTDNNVYLYAKWIKTYDINYHLGGGVNSASNPATFSEKTLPVTLSAPTREGFVFAGWYQNPTFSGSQVTTIETGTEKNVSLWAKWNAIEYSISYVLNGGTNSEQNVATYTILDTPVKLFNPTYGGKVFEGWFKSSDFSGGRVTYLSKEGLGDVTLYAKWSTAYTITYNTNGGLNDGRNPSVFTENTETFTLFEAEKVNYSFIGWFDNEEFTGTPITQIAKGTKNNIVLWAKWNSAQITVTFDANGGGVSPLTKVVKKDETYGELPTPSRPGYTFDGWFEIPAEYQKVEYLYFSGAQYINTGFVPTADTAVEVAFNTSTDGKWIFGSRTAYQSKDTYALHLYTGSNAIWFQYAGTGPSQQTVSAYSGKKTTLKVDKDYMYVNGNKINSTAFGISGYTNGTLPMFLGEINNNGSKDGRSFVGNIYSFKVWNGNTLVRDFVPVVRKSDSVAGMYDRVEGKFYSNAGSGSFTVGQASQQITSETTLIKDVDHTLYAHWTEEIYSITYNLDGGTNAAGNPATFTCSSLPISLSDATKTGLYFAGWYTDSAFTSKRLTQIAAGSLKNIELWARFSQSPLVFDLVGSSAYSVRAANTSISGNIEIPQTYNGKPVVVIQNSAFKDCSNVTSVLIPNSIKSIGINAFENCSNITEITIPEGVTLIGNNTFLGCEKLASVTLPTSIESFGANAFAGCTSLTSIVLPKNIQEIGANAFANCSKLATIEVFGDTPATLKTGVFPSSVSKIYVKPSLVATYKTAWAEYKDKIVGFTEYSITYNLNGGTNSAKNISSFTKIDVPIKLYDPTKENADFLGWYATSDFSGEKVTEITTVSNVTLYARWDRKMTITYVLNGGKNNAANLSIITESMLPYTLMPADKDNYTFIAWFLDDALTNQISSITNFGDITVYAAWEELNPYLVFTLNTDNTAYSVKASSTGVEGAIKIPSIHRGKPVTTIEPNAFANCSKMTDLFIPSSVTSIGSSAFSNCSGDLLICSEVISKPNGWSYEADIYGVKYLPTSNNEWKYVEKLDGTLIAVKYLGNSTNVKIPNSIDEKNVFQIYNNCFKNKSSIISIEISNNITDIGSNAFYNCSSMRRIYIPISVTTISASSSSYSPFYGWNSSAIIYCGASSRPSGWGSDWNYYDSSNVLTVVWGVSGLGVYDSDWEYVEKSDGTIKIIKYIGTGTIVTVPSTLSGKTVSEIYDNCFKNKTSITSVTIPSSVTSIGSSAFYGCSGLTSINIPDGVTSIGGSAFSGCSGLTSINIPDSVTSIYGSAFYNCSNLTLITIPNSVTSIGIKAFYNCSSMRKIYIPISVTTISASSYSDSPFYGWNSSAVIYCGASSQPSGWGSYWNCYYNYSNRLSVVWNVGGTLQNDGNWEYIEKLDGTIRVEKYIGSATAVTVPATLSGKTVSEIYDYCFEYNTSITSVIISSSVTRIGYSAFYGCSGMTSITLSNKLTNIGSSAFQNCSGLTKVNITDLSSWFKISFSYSTSNPLYYAHHLYLNNTELTEITIPSSITKINANVLVDASSITSITIPSSVTSIGSYAFSGCSGLTSITIPSSVTSIGNNAFHNCSSMRKIYIPISVTTISASSYSDSPFYGWNSSAVIYCGAASKPSDWGSYWNYYNSSSQLKVVWNVAGFEQNSEWEYLEKNDGTIGVLKYLGSEVEVAVPSTLSGKTVSKIYGGCFENNATITSVTIQDSVTNIGNSAFYNCSGLTSVTMGSSVTSIGDSVFSGCKGLTSISIPNGVTSIGNYAFYNCSGLTSINIPDGVTSIGVNAFGYCTGLTKIYIPASVTTITTSNNTSSPFYGCKSSLKIYCGASSKPSGWGQYWNYYKSSGSGGNLLSVTWGASGLPES